MKFVIIFSAIFCMAYCQQNIDIDAVLKNQRLFNNYVDCLLDRKPCTSNGRQLKEQIPSALENNCKNCNPKQRENIEKAIGFLIKNKPDIWKQLQRKYDPDNKYVERYKNIVSRYT
nr:chemosensory protein 7 [Lytta caraganae]